MWVWNFPRAQIPVLAESHFFEPPNFTYPFGTHIAVVEVDADTGEVEMQRYIAVDDCGNIINPLIVEGQVHGGIAQGVGQALYEEAIYDGKRADDHRFIYGLRLAQSAQFPAL